MVGSDAVAQAGAGLGAEIVEPAGVDCTGMVAGCTAWAPDTAIAEEAAQSVEFSRECLNPMVTALAKNFLLISLLNLCSFLRKIRENHHDFLAHAILTQTISHL